MLLKYACSLWCAVNVHTHEKYLVFKKVFVACKREETKLKRKKESFFYQTYTSSSPFLSSSTSTAPRFIMKYLFPVFRWHSAYSLTHSLTTVWQSPGLTASNEIIISDFVQLKILDILYICKMYVLWPKSIARILRYGPGVTLPLYIWGCRSPLAA